MYLVYIMCVSLLPLADCGRSPDREDREDRDEMKITTMSIMVTLDII